MPFALIIVLHKKNNSTSFDKYLQKFINKQKKTILCVCRLNSDMKVNNIYSNINNSITTCHAQNKINKNQKKSISFAQRSHALIYKKPNDLGQYKLPIIKRYLSEQDFARKMEKLGYINTGNWCEFYSKGKDIQGPWKMHIYADNLKDYQDIANCVLPYLRTKNVKHKCLGSNHSIYEQLKTDQAGKAFTIYPSSNQEMEQIAKDIDYIVRNNNLVKQNSFIQGDRMMGRSGRLFYRYEYQSGKYEDIYLDMNQLDINPKIIEQLDKNIIWSADKGPEKLYRYGLYEGNRGGNNYLASDMRLQDDIWFDFDPSNPKSARKIKVKQTKSKIYPNVPIILEANPNHEYGLHIKDRNTGEWFVFDKTMQCIVRDISMEEKTKSLALA